MKAVKSTPSIDEFEIMLVDELKQLRKAEKALQRMYPRLESKPQLRSRFLQQLADMQHRAERLDGVLNPFNARQIVDAQMAAAQVSVA